nr:MarR family transcriptional regulator [uncultured Merdimonas sp.]
MEIKDVKLFLDSCHAAKRIIELMPKLPKGMTPRHIHVIDAIWQISQEYGAVKVSDVSLFLKVTRPSVTRLINELADLGVVQKLPDPVDHRSTLVKLTGLGQKYYDFYVDQYHSWLARQCSDIDPECFRITAETLFHVFEILSMQKMEVPENE